MIRQIFFLLNAIEESKRITTFPFKTLFGIYRIIRNNQRLTCLTLIG
jgi:hypothetical protein